MKSLKTNKMKTKSKKNTKPLLSDKIADALTIKPRADIEDDQVFGTKPHTVSRADFSSSESEDDATISDFRKRNVNLLSEISKKYEGQEVTRKDLDKNSSETEIESGSDGGDDGGFQSKLASIASKFTQQDSDESDEEQSETKKGKNASGSEDLSLSSDGESDDYSITQRPKGSDSESDEEDDEDGDGYDISQMEDPVKEEFEHMKKQNVSEEAKKGACVRNQLLVWEGLLEMRIHLQRCMTTANEMPFPEVHQELRQNNEFAEACSAATTNIASILDKFLSLQSMLLKGFPETKTLFTKKQAAETTSEKKEDSDEEIPSDMDNEEIPSDTEEEDNTPVEGKSAGKSKNKEQPQKKRKLADYESELATSHKVFKPFRDATIQKWNEKTRLATATNLKNTPTNTILQQISFILSDRNKLIKRTQLKRSEYDIVGYKKSSDVDNTANGEENPVMKDRKHDDEYISEIFDDSDFYHQLLRELIECKSADISDPVQLSRQWIALQQMRSKMKRKVDTKATKGRKIKYVVHNQLVNYMAPEKCTTWTDESTNELYSSLFGKMFEHNNVGLNANLENGLKIKD